MLYELGWVGKLFIEKVASVKQTVKFGGGERSGGQRFLPQPPIPFCPPERQISFLPSRQRREQSVRSFLQMSLE